MSKEKNPTTLEDALVAIEALKSNHAAELEASQKVAEAAQKEVEELTTELGLIKEKHAKELDEAKDQVRKFTKSVPGTYKSKDHNVTIRFKDGHVKTRVKGELVLSEDLIKNKGGKHTEFLDHLIEIGYGGIEEVK
jgi:C4-type Zn-finger protein